MRLLQYRPCASPSALFLYTWVPRSTRDGRMGRGLRTSRSAPAPGSGFRPRISPNADALFLHPPRRPLQSLPGLCRPGPLSALASQPRARGASEPRRSSGSEGPCAGDMEVSVSPPAGSGLAMAALSAPARRALDLEERP